MQQSNPTNPQPAKKVYHSPRLSVYGKIRELTQNTNTGATADGVFMMFTS